MSDKTREQAIVEAVNYAKAKWICNAHHETWGFKVSKAEFDACVNDMKRALWLEESPSEYCAKIYQKTLMCSVLFSAGFAAGIVAGVFLIASK